MVGKIELGAVPHLMYRLQAAMTPHFAGQDSEAGRIPQPQEIGANRFVEAEGQ